MSKDPSRSRNSTHSAKDRNRRSTCPVSCALDVVGDKWTLLVIRDLVLGRTRFKEFTDSPEGIPTNILTERLNRLQRHGVIERRPVSEGVRRYTYHLTEKGNALRPLLKTMLAWGTRYEGGDPQLMKDHSKPHSTDRLTSSAVN